MGESFNIYEFLNMMKNITPEELADMLLMPFCILLTALCIGQFINSLVENRLAKHFADSDAAPRPESAGLEKRLPPVRIQVEVIHNL